MSGASDPAPDGFLDTGISENGAGSAASTSPFIAQSSFDTNSFLNGLGKFGTSIGSLFAKSSAPRYTVHPGPSPYANPYRRNTSGINSTHAVLVFIVIGGLIAVIALGGHSA